MQRLKCQFKKLLLLLTFLGLMKHRKLHPVVVFDTLLLTPFMHTTGLLRNNAFLYELLIKNVICRVEEKLMTSKMWNAGSSSSTAKPITVTQLTA